MATRIHAMLEDDLDKSPASESIRFLFDGAEYNIDLSAKNAELFRQTLAPWVRHARCLSLPRNPLSTGRRTGRTDLAEVRSWARLSGRVVSDRGPVASHILEAFDARKEVS